MKQRFLIIASGFLILILTLFTLIFTVDNKYTAEMPKASYGLITVTPEDMQGLVFLIDDWFITYEDGTQEYSYIGQYANLRGDNPHATASYMMEIDYDGQPCEVALYFPALFFDYEVLLNDVPLANGEGSLRTSFTLTSGIHNLTVKTKSATGFYSGIYHPPVFGDTSKVSTMISVQSMAYTMASFGTLVLMLFTLNLWRNKKDIFGLYYGSLCAFFSLYLSYYFVRLYGFSFGEYWYIIQCFALYGICLCVLKLVALVSGKQSALIEKIVISLSAILLMLGISIPWFGFAIRIHSTLTNIYYLLVLGAVLWFSIHSKTENKERQYTVFACIAFALGLLYNLVASNLFEPIYLFWQFEWCGLILVTLFGAIMVGRNQSIINENSAYQTHLEDMVTERTNELTQVLNERKAFFADMAHDLKAPVYATTSFIDAIRAGSTGLDEDMLRYLDLVEEKQQEMAMRVQGLNEFNRIDGLESVNQDIVISDLLARIYQRNEMSTQVHSIYFEVKEVEQNGIFSAPLQKIDILFENLIFNAIKFTAPEGKITLSASADETGCHFTLSDTGCGISPDEIPYLFDRFYVGIQGKKEGGSGLGLYIVKSIVDSLDGEISVSSKVNKGTVFFIDFPRNI